MSAIGSNASLIVRADIPAGSEVPIDTSLSKIATCAIQGNLQEAFDRYSVRPQSLASFGAVAAGVALVAGGVILGSQNSVSEPVATFDYQPPVNIAGTELDVGGPQVMNLLDFNLNVEDGPAQLSVATVFKAAVPTLVGLTTVRSQMPSSKRKADAGDYREFVSSWGPKELRLQQYGLEEAAARGDPSVVSCTDEDTAETLSLATGSRIPGAESACFFGSVTRNEHTGKSLRESGDESCYTYSLREGYSDVQSAVVSGINAGFTSGHDEAKDPDFLTELRGGPHKSAITSIFLSNQNSESRVRASHKVAFTELGEDRVEEFTIGDEEQLEELKKELLGLHHDAQIPLTGPYGVLSPSMGAWDEQELRSNGLPKTRARPETSWAVRSEADVYKPL